MRGSFCRLVALASVFAFAFAFALASDLRAGGCYSPSYSYYSPSYCSPSYSYSYCSPSYSYCPPSPCYEAFHYDQPGWFRGRWYPAGWYQWRGSYWYLRGYGACYGYACPEDYYGRGRSSCEPTYISQFQGLVGIPIPTYYSTYVPPPALPGTSGAAYGTQPAATQATTTAATQPAAVAVTQPSATAAATQPAVTDAAKILVAIGTLNTNVLSLDTRTRDFDTRLRRLEGTRAPTQLEPGPAPTPRTSERAPPPMPPPAPALSAASVLADRCASCHTASRLFQGKDTHGDDRHASLAILAADGQVAAISGPMLNKILEHVEAGTMPPTDIAHQSGKLTVEESGILRTWLKEQIGTPASRRPSIERKIHAKVLVPLRSALADLDGR